LIYESAKWHNCVFVGRDDSGKARYASLRGTTGDYKCDVESSDKRFGFVLPPIAGESDTVIAFESPAFNEYSKAQLKVKTQKPSLLARLEKAKELAKQIAAPVKNRSKGGHEL